MREILFRGKSVENGGWIEGYVFPQYIDCGYAPLCITKEPIWANDHLELLGDWTLGDWLVVDPSTVGQYTGLTDKNGKKIFEGDIVNTDFSEVGEIVWCENYYMWQVRYHQSLTLKTHQPLMTMPKCEVIGNIHDNPDLLEDKT